MIVFQSTPCRLYPKILELIGTQFKNSIYVHEVYQLKEKHPNNPLDITKDNFVFDRSEFTYGMFKEKKVPKQKGDFWFTIKMPEERLIEEFYAFCSFQADDKFLYQKPRCPKHRRIHFIFKKFGEKVLGRGIDFFKETCTKNDIDTLMIDESYTIRRKWVADDSHFDYIGNFDEWEKTITDLKQLINLDLSVLKDENPYSYINNWKISK